MKNIIITFFLISSILIFGCSISKTVKPIQAGNINLICIKKNDTVFMKGFVNEIQRIIENKGIKTKILTSEVPNSCVHRLEYTANWAWDLAMYLTYADIRIYENDQLIGNVEYDAKSGGGRLDKFGKTSEKIGPLMDELFSNVVANKVY